MYLKTNSQTFDQIHVLVGRNFECRRNIYRFNNFNIKCLILDHNSMILLITRRENGVRAKRGRCTIL